MLVKFTTEYMVDLDYDVWVEWSTGANWLTVMADDCEIAKHAISTDGKAFFPTVGRAAEKARAILEAMEVEDRYARAHPAEVTHVPGKVAGVDVMFVRDPHTDRDR